MGRDNLETFSITELRQKLHSNPTCYLTGEKIDLTKGETFSFDHIIPASRGGKSSLDNLGLTSTIVNRAKTNLTPQEFIQLCKTVLEHNGYEVKLVGLVGTAPNIC